MTGSLKRGPHALMRLGVRHRTSSAPVATVRQNVPALTPNWCAVRAHLSSREGLGWSPLTYHSVFLIDTHAAVPYSAIASSAPFLELDAQVFK